MKKLFFIPIPIQQARSLLKSTWDRCIQADFLLCATDLMDALIDDLPKFKDRFFFGSLDELSTCLKTIEASSHTSIALLYPIDMIYGQSLIAFKSTLESLSQNYTLEILPTVSPLMLSSYQVLGLVEYSFNLSFRQKHDLPHLHIDLIKTETELIEMMGLSHPIDNAQIDNAQIDNAQTAILSGIMTNRPRLIEDFQLQSDDAKIIYPCYVLKGAISELKNTLNLKTYYPLQNQEIIITRADGQISALSEPLQALGATTIPCPSIAIHPMESQDDLAKIDTAIQTLHTYDWVIFTSVNGVRYFLERLYHLGFDMRAFKNAKIACIGSATAKALKQWGLKTDMIPKAYVAESLIEAFENLDLQNLGKRVLIPRALEAREILPNYLESKGLFVNVLPIYQTKSAKISAKIKDEILAELKTNQAKRIICFTANSTVEHFCALWTDSELKRIQANTVAIAIGPISGQKAQKIGFRLVAQAEVFHIEGLVDAVVKYLQS
jgi:uroporphyrinogen III methyltransferase/synthase